MYGKYARHTDKEEPVEKFVSGVMKLLPSARLRACLLDDTLLQSGSETAGRRDAPEVAGRIAGPASYRQAFHDRVIRLSTPWKMDILDFMNENYMYEFTLEELAHYTGRSLATFKRDFKKVSALTPEKWLIRKRLEVAYHLLKEERRKVVDVYAEVGFKNLRILYGLQETLRHSAHGTGRSLVHLNFSETIFEPHGNVSVGLLCYFCLRRIIE